MVSQAGDTDDDLTNLNWLQANNILDLIPYHVIPVEQNYSDSRLSSTDAESVTADESAHTASALPPPVAFCEDTQVSTEPSLSSLIFMAIDSSPDKMLPIKQICSWIVGHSHSDRRGNNWWRTAVRRQLDRSKCFKRFTSIDSVSNDQMKCVSVNQLFLKHLPVEYSGHGECRQYIELP